MNTEALPVRYTAPDAEKLLLCALLEMPAALPQVAAVVAPQDFLDPGNRAVYECMAALDKAGEQWDFEILAMRYPDPATILALPAKYGGQANPLRIMGYAKILIESSMRRQLSAALDGEARLSLSDHLNRVETAAQEVRQRLLSIQPVAGKSEILAELVERLTGEYDPTLAGLKTGLMHLDRLLGGLKRGDLIIVGARPSMGKTSLATTIAWHVAAAGGHVLFFSAEVGDRPIYLKLLCLQSRVPWSDIDAMRLSDAQQAAIAEAAGPVDAMPIDVVPAREWTIAQIRAKARQIHADTPLDLIIVDYLQEVSTERRHENRNLEVGAIARESKSMALELKVPVLEPTQVSRRAEERENGRPELSDLRESGEIEQAADIILFLYREQNADEAVVIPTTVEVAKYRMGAKGITTLGFLGERMEFVDLMPQVVGYAGAGGAL